MINPAALSPAVLDSAALILRAEPGWLWTLEGTVAVIVAVLLIGLLGAIALLIWRLSKAFERIVDAVEKFRTDILPVTEKAASIAEHLEEAALSVKDSVEGVTDTINTANEALRDAVATADARFREFDAIVRVARDEAEDAVVGAASVIRGVRSSASAFRHRRGAHRDEDDTESDAPVPSQRRRGGPRTRHQRSGDAE